MVFFTTDQIWNQSFGPKAQTPKIPYARSGHQSLKPKQRGMMKAEERILLHGLRHAMEEA
jgi:hypothetical protein